MKTETPDERLAARRTLEEVMRKLEEALKLTRGQEATAARGPKAGGPDALRRAQASAPVGGAECAARMRLLNE